MNPLMYAKSVPPRTRVGRFVADEGRLAWLFKFLSKHKKADSYIVGGTARDAVRGRVPKQIHVLMRNVPLVDLVDMLGAFGRAVPHDDSSVNLFLAKQQNSEPIHLTIPRTPKPDPFAPVTHDLAHRDFTMNALAYSLKHGDLFDPFGGIHDLEGKRLRVVGKPKTRFLERPLRMLRALRFAAQYHYQIEDSTWRGIQENLGKLNRVVAAEDGSATYATPRHHIGREFIQLLHHPLYGMQLWKESGALEKFTPELSKLDRIEHRHGHNAWNKAELMLHDIGGHHPHLAFASLFAFLEDLAVQSAKDVMTRLHLHAAHPNFDHAQALSLIKERDILDHVDPDELTPSLFEHAFGGTRGEHLLMLLNSLHKTHGRHTLSRERLHRAERRRKHLLTDILKPPLLRGRDLGAVGIRPGPHYREILDQVRDAQLAKEISNKEEALNFVRQLLATT